jgi:hypothetical protein
LFNYKLVFFKILLYNKILKKALMATKFVYTESELKEIAAKYAQGVALEALAEQYTKSVASVRMRLVKLGVYKAVSTTAKAEADNLETYKRCVADAGYAPL